MEELENNKIVSLDDVEKNNLVDELKTEINKTETLSDNINQDKDKEISKNEEISEDKEISENEEISEDEDRINKAKKEAKWYVLHTFSGYENVAKENLEIVIDKYNLQERIFDIVIPLEDVVEEKNGKRKIVTRKLMPGYILVKMNYGDDIWHAVTRTRGITGFVGPKGRPLHLTSEEIRKMRLEKVTIINSDLKVNDKVEVLEGALNGFIGVITSLDIVSNKCRVLVEMFGRETPVDLTLEQIRKIQ